MQYKDILTKYVVKHKSAKLLSIMERLYMEAQDDCSATFSEYIFLFPACLMISHWLTMWNFPHFFFDGFPYSKCILCSRSVFLIPSEGKFDSSVYQKSSDHSNLYPVRG